MATKLLGRLLARWYCTYTDGAIQNQRERNVTVLEWSVRQRACTYVAGTCSFSNKSSRRFNQPGSGRDGFICDMKILMSSTHVIRSGTSHPPQTNWTNFFNQLLRPLSSKTDYRTYEHCSLCIPHPSVGCLFLDQVDL